MKFDSIGSYEANSSLPAFLGLNQYPANNDPRYADESVNMYTHGGIIEPYAPCEALTPELNAPIETLMRLYRRWHSGNDKEILVAASGGKLYYMLPTATAWTQLTMPTGVTSFASNKWSWVTYEYNDNGTMVDILVISNKQDGMFLVTGNLVVTKVTTPKKFGVIERYAERIWGGDIDEDPDMLMYSVPYDPTDWEINDDVPEDGAGVIRQPSWDGDSFTALKAFGSQLIAFKRHRVWRILGTDPGEYTFKEQYGGGAESPRTIGVHGEYILLLGKDGVYSYDGLNVSPFQQEYCADIFKKISIGTANAVFYKNKYYISFKYGTTTYNNAVLVYNTEEGTWLYRNDVCVEAFLPAEDDLYFTSSTTPGKIWKWHEDSWEYGYATGNTRWVTPWNDLGNKKLIKGGFEVFFWPESKENTEIKISVQTEKKVKTKKYVIKPGSKQKRLHFGGNGRKFRLIIESDEGLWRIPRGFLITSELDSD